LTLTVVDLDLNRASRLITSLQSIEKLQCAGSRDRVEVNIEANERVNMNDAVEGNVAGRGHRRRQGDC
jgi:hypothetical protein